MNLISKIRTLARVTPAARGRPAGGRARTSRSSWTATAAGHGGAGCRPRSATAPARARCGAPSRAAIDLGVQQPRRLRVLDRELVAAAGRGRRADGDLRRDDRARAARPRRAGRPRALHRPARPRARRAARAHGGDGGPHRAELAARALDRVRLRRARRARRAARRIAESGMEPREIDENVARGSTSTRRSCPIPTC